jgi:hypothetical protein
VHIETRNSGNTYLMRCLGFIVAIVAIIAIIAITVTIVVGEKIIRASVVFVTQEVIV